jgi:hypothetical protein
MEQLSVDIAARIQWSHWSNCESSFNLVLVPHHPGVYALAEEIAETETGGEMAANAEGVAAEPFVKRRKLAIFAVNETGNLAYAISSLFAVGNPVGEHMAHSRCYVRYAVIEDAAQRREVYNALDTWLALSVKRAKENSTQYAVPSVRKWPFKSTDVSAQDQLRPDVGAKR